MNDIFSSLPSGCSASPVSEAGFFGQFISIPKSVLSQPEGNAFQIAQPLRWVALHRYLPWWPRPVFGSGEFEFDGELFMALWEREEGGCAIALPLVDGSLRGILRGAKGGLSIRVSENDPLPDSATLLLVATGNDPLALVQWAIKKVSERLGTFRLRSEKAIPTWVNYFGWCTWDAFYKEVTAEKVLQGLESLKQAGFSPRFLILDDGWQDVQDEQLLSFHTQPERFPQGLKPLVDKAKAEYGVKLFAVWHAFEGYWNGVNPKGSLADQYRLVLSEGIAYNMVDAASVKRSLVHPADVARFYDDYYTVLRAEGVDMVKVDNQASLDHFCTREAPPTAVMQAYQAAFQSAAQKHFHGETLHCMSNTPDAVYSLKTANVWRNSQDFFPAEPQSHASHIFDNTLNAMWVGTFALPDWDMFQSGHPAGAYHAAARAISGGPVYVSDKPGQHDPAVLSKLMLGDGRILRSTQPALPARDSIFEDGRIVPRVTKVVNFNKVEGWVAPIGVLGLFNCYYSKTEQGAVSGEYCAADVPAVSGARCALYHHTTGNVAVAAAPDRFPVRLESLGYEVVTVSPVLDGVALFGLLDKFNGSRALESARWTSASELELVLADGGRVGWFSEKPAVSAIFNGASIEITQQGSLSWVRLPEGAPASLLLRFA